MYCMVEYILACFRCLHVCVRNKFVYVEISFKSPFLNNLATAAAVADPQKIRRLAYAGDAILATTE